MKLNHFVFAMCFSLSVVAAPQTKIVGGTTAAAGEVPFIVSLQKRSQHFCGGSLVASNWVLTAAHCVRGNTLGLKVLVGLLKQGNLSGVETFSVRKVLIHPENRSSTNDYDFALLLLNGNSKKIPIALNQMSLSVPDDESTAQRVFTAGWGNTSEGGGLPTNLMKVEVPLVSTKRCESAYPGEITKSMVCAGFDKGAKDACQGDSGGPLYMRLPNGEPILLGVVSWGEGCARPKKYGVYGDVYSALSWIESQIAWD